MGATQALLASYGGGISVPIEFIFSSAYSKDNGTVGLVIDLQSLAINDLVVLNVAFDATAEIVPPAIGGQNMTFGGNYNGVGVTTQMYYRTLDGTESDAIITASLDLPVPIIGIGSAFSGCADAAPEDVETTGNILAGTITMAEDVATHSTPNLVIGGTGYVSAGGVYDSGPTNDMIRLDTTTTSSIQLEAAYIIRTDSTSLYNSTLTLTADRPYGNVASSFGQ